MCTAEMPEQTPSPAGCDLWKKKPRHSVLASLWCGGWQAFYAVVLPWGTWNRWVWSCLVLQHKAMPWCHKAERPYSNAGGKATNLPMAVLMPWTPARICCRKEEELLFARVDKGDPLWHLPPAQLPCSSPFAPAAPMHPQRKVLLWTGSFSGSIHSPTSVLAVGEARQMMAGPQEQLRDEW